MSTLQIHAPTMSPLAGFARVISLLNILIEAFVEAQREAAAPHKRYPFAEW
jgi:hypothetical protein